MNIGICRDIYVCIGICSGAFMYVRVCRDNGESDGKDAWKLTAKLGRF